MYMYIFVLFPFQIADLLDVGSSIDLDLDPVLSPVPEITVFHQKNTKASCKKVLPVIKSFLHGAKTPDVTNKDFLPPETVSMATEGFTSYITKMESEEPEISSSVENPTILLDFGTSDHSETLNTNLEHDSGIIPANVTVIDKFSRAAHVDSNQLFELEQNPKKKIPFDPFRNVVSSSELTSFSSSNYPSDFMTSLSCDLVDPFSSVEENNQANQTNQSANPFLAANLQDTNPFTTDNENFNTDPTTLGEIDKRTNEYIVENVNVDLLDTGQNMNPFISEAEKIRQLNMNEAQTMDKMVSENAKESEVCAGGPTLNPFEVFEDFGIRDTLDTEQKDISDIPVSSSFEERAYELHQYIEDPNPFLTAANKVYNINIDSVSDTSPDFDTGFGTVFDNDRNRNAEAGIDMSDQDTNVSNSAPFLDALGLEYLAARPKARKSISLIVEVENTDSLADLNESDFYDKVQTPSPGHSGSNSPFVSSGVSTPFESVSAFHSLRASSSDSGYPSVTQTPPNSMVEGSFAGIRDFDLPSFNNAEMVARIQKKKASIGAGVDLLGLIPEPVDSTPYTPQNSFREDSEVLSSDHILPSLNNDSMMKKIQEKRSSLSAARENTSAEELDFDEVKRDEGEPTGGNDSMDPFRGKVNSPNFDMDGFDPYTPGPDDSYINTDMNNYARENLVKIVSCDEEIDSDDPLGLNIQPKVSSEIKNKTNDELFPSDKSRNLLADFSSFTPANSYVESKGHFMQNRKSIPDDKELLDRLINLKDKLNEEDIYNDDSLPDVSEKDRGRNEFEHSLQDNPNKPVVQETYHDLLNMDITSTSNPTSDQNDLVSKDVQLSKKKDVHFPDESDENQIGISKEESLTIARSNGLVENDLETVLSKFGPEITDKAREQALLEVATSFAKEVIADAVERFPEVRNPTVADIIAMEMLEGDDAQWLKQLSQDSFSSGSQSTGKFLLNFTFHR